LPLFIASWTNTEWETMSIPVEGERVDHITASDKKLDLPCFGMFEIEGGCFTAPAPYQFCLT
jgi:hypothetical protein